MRTLGDEYAASVGYLRPSGVLHYIGRTVCLGALRHFIIDERLTANDTILLNSSDFDSVIIEHRNTYLDGMVVPFHFLEVQIAEDQSGSTPKTRVQLVRRELPSSISRERDEDMSAHDIAYRCGWCGNIVDESGALVKGAVRIDIIRSIEHALHPAAVVKVDGACCTGVHRQ